MTNNNEEEIWAYNDLHVDEETGKVEGYAYTHERNGRDVSVAVNSYGYERNGEQRMNHVPHIVVQNEDGDIVAEPHAWDSQIAKKAIENGIEAAESIWKYSIDAL